MTSIPGGPAVRADGMPHARPPGRALGRVAKHGLWVVAAILLAGCSAGFDKYFGSDKAPPKPPEPTTATEQSTEDAQEVPGKEQAYPNLGSVPQTKPIRQSAQEQTVAVAKGLVADRQNARYTDEVIRRDPVQAASAPRTVVAPPRLPTAPATGAAGASPPAAAAPPAAPAPALAAVPPPPPAPASLPTQAATPQPVNTVPPAVPAAPPPVAAAPPPPAGVLAAPQPAQPPLLPSGQAPQLAQGAPQPADVPGALPTAQPGAASVEQPPAVAPSPVPTMASVAQQQFQPPPPPVIPGYTPQAAAQQPVAQPGYPPQAYAPPTQLAALPPTATQRPVLIPPPGYGLPPAASALAPAPSGPYVPTATPGAGNPIRPPPPPISPALPAIASRGYDPAIVEARARAGAPVPDAAVAEARRRAAFSPGQQVGLLLFEHGSASLSAQDRALLQRVAAVARQNGAIVRVVGHASSRAGEANGLQNLNRNFNISEARASAAAAELNAAGLPVERIVIEAKGNSEPLYSEAQATGEAGNRRVDVFIQ